MLYPTIKQYIDALRLTEENFDQLASFRLVTEADGSPVMSSGNFAVVFKMQDTRDGSFHALKCFLKDQPGRAEAYRAIADELEQVVSPYLTRIQYLEDELFVGTSSGGAEYPVLVMDWVEGLTLDNYLRSHLSAPYALHLLAYQFGRLAAWLLTQPFAHGDLKPDNILVRPDGTLVLVDYDGMFVPAMQGQRAPEMGSPDFRHPDRADADFSEHIDDFALASILLSLRAVAYCPDYLNRYGAADRLLLSEADYRSPEQSTFLRDEFPTPDAELNRIYALFLLALSERTLSQVSFRLFNLQKPIALPPILEVITSPATEEEIAEGVVDAYGVVYSRDGKELLKYQNESISHYHVDVRDGCQVIREDAFGGCVGLISITLPDGLTHIGDRAFWGCYNLPAIILPDSLLHIGNDAFMICKSLTSITLPANLKHIGKGAFAETGIRNVISYSPYFTFSNGCLIDIRKRLLLFFLSDQEQAILQEGLTDIGFRAFYDCKDLTTISLPTTLENIDESAFYVTGIRNVINLSPYFSFSNGCLIDKKNHRLLAFLSNQEHTILPNGLLLIGNGAFSGCKRLTTIALPDGLTHIGEGAFSGCNNLTDIILPSSLTHIGNNAFMFCDKLNAITLPNSLTNIGDSVFFACSRLTAITLPACLTHVGKDVLGFCYNLSHIYIPNGMRTHFEALLEPKYHSKIKEEIRDDLPF